MQRPVASLMERQPEATAGGPTPSAGGPGEEAERLPGAFKALRVITPIKNEALILLATANHAARADAARFLKGDFLAQCLDDQQSNQPVSACASNLASRRSSRHGFSQK